MRDFTTDSLILLLSSLKSAGYKFMTVAGYLYNPTQGTVILRHDVDARPENSLRCALMEQTLGITGTYYVRTVPGAWNEDVIREIYRLGHEVGYHYEDLAAAGGNPEKAIGKFEENLAKLRRVVPVETICMHGSPVSKHDNRLLWEKYNYRNYGIIGEPYLNIDFQTVTYLTDTGRCWNGERYSIRDRILPREQNGIRENAPVKSGTVPEEGGMNSTGKGVSGMSGTAPGEREMSTTGKGMPGTNGNGKRETETGHNTDREKRYEFRSTHDIIEAAKSGDLPPVMMITIHPQRWDNRLIPWLKELIWQNTKNVVKRFLTTS